MIDLPDYPGPQSAEPGLVDYGGFLSPPLGGPIQRIDRMGNKFKIAVTMPPMSGSEGRVWIARLIKGKSEGARMEYPLLDFAPGYPGTPLVNGSGQAGRFLNLKSCRPNYVYREGQFISVKTGGRHHLIMVDGQAVVASDGTVTVPITPMIRVSHLDNDEVHVSKPMIEGYILGNEQRWRLQVGNFVNLSFEIEEAA
jgi:hypothetical protein